MQFDRLASFDVLVRPAFTDCLHVDLCKLRLLEFRLNFVGASGQV